MDNETVEKIIEMVRGHQFLYDINHPQYKNAGLKLKIWESIGRELNLSDEAVRNKWKTVRDGYSKYRKQQKTSTGSSRKKVCHYTWASHLAFLDDFNMSRGSHSNVSTQPSPLNQTPTSDSEHSQDVALQYVLPTASSQVLPPESQGTSTRVSSLHNKRPSESRENDDVERILHFLKAKKRKELDVIDNLFLSYADTFKKFPPRNQAIVKLEIARLFTNTELELLKNNSDESKVFKNN